MWRGLLVALCGPDGAGKTTQSYSLYEALRHKGLRTAIVKQHTPSYYSSILIDPRNNEEKAEYASRDRFQQYKEQILPSLTKNDIVIVDRYVCCTYAYGLARGVALNEMMDSNKNLPMADVTIFLDSPTEMCMGRIRHRGGAATDEEMNGDFQKTLRKHYIDQPWGFSHEYHIVDGSREFCVITQEIEQIVIEARNNVIAARRAEI